MVSAADLMQKDFLKVEKDSVLSQVFGKMISSKKTVAIVMDKNNFAGLISIKGFLRKKISNPSEAKTGTFLEAVPSLEASTPERLRYLTGGRSLRPMPGV